MITLMLEPLSQYHLYLSKDSPIRSEIHILLEDTLYEIDTTSFNRDKIRAICSELFESELHNEKPRQVNYGIIDFLLFVFVKTEGIEKVYDFLFDTFRHYIVLHEIAALSWGDEIIHPSIVFELIKEKNISEKHIYHLLNEMSTSYPRRTYKFAQELLEGDKIMQSTINKLAKSMLQDRQSGRKLSKNVIPKLSKKEIAEMLKELDD